MNRLAAHGPGKARSVERRYFGVLTVEQTAQAIGQPPATVKRHWQAARL
ncbi:MAG: ECF-type sigma factor [Xanthomonadales bacterium]|nr:ECF-type sigma factor [Xanthomonadales bacterium]